jgi:rhodanese-related sulfurtransferase
MDQEAAWLRAALADAPEVALAALLAALAMLTGDRAGPAAAMGRAVPSAISDTTAPLTAPKPKVIVPDIAEALPANLRGGKPRASTTGTGQPPVTTQNWGPIERSYAGLPELPPSWVGEHLDAVQLLDVRSHEEAAGPDGSIPGSRLIPLPELTARVAELSAERPVVVVCHSGSRSALATQKLLKAGFTQVANLRGGLRAWNGVGLPMVQQLPSSNA